MAIDTYIPNSIRLPEDYTTSKVIEFMSFLKYFLFSSFLLEVVLKIIAYGMIFEDDSYLADHWNKLDFFIVVANIANEMFP